MSELAALPIIRMAVEAVHGHVDFGGERFGFILLVEKAELRIWRVSAVPTEEPIPDVVWAWVQRKSAEAVLVMLS